MLSVLALSLLCVAFAGRGNDSCLNAGTHLQSFPIPKLEAQRALDTPELHGSLPDSAKLRAFMPFSPLQFVDKQQFRAFYRLMQKLVCGDRVSVMISGVSE